MHSKIYNRFKLIILSHVTHTRKKEKENKRMKGRKEKGMKKEEKAKGNVGGKKERIK